jgi:hypothetical protein
MMTDTKNSVGTSCTSRRAMNVSTAWPFYSSCVGSTRASMRLSHLRRRCMGCRDKPGNDDGE